MENMYSLVNKTALITGGASGMGRAMATGMSKAGAKVAIIDVSEKVYDVADDITKETGNEVFAVQGNLANRDGVVIAFNESIKKLGGTITILVNCAGVAISAPVEEYPMDKWDFVMQVNVTACYQLSQLAVPYMKAAGYGKIINMCSMLSFFGASPGSSSYSISKGALMQMTKSLSNELAAFGICVNALAPGYMETPLNNFIIANKPRVESINARIPKGRWGTPADIIGPALFLASSASDYVTGAVLPVDGGYLCR